MIDPILILAAEAVDDLETTRIANENRLRSLRDVYGLAGSTQEAELAGLVEGITKLEAQATLTLRRAVRKHPVYPWIKASNGVGEKQAARLLAAVGDPYLRPTLTRSDGTVEPERPRTVSELWAYCGFHVLPVNDRETGQGHVDTQEPVAGLGGDSGQRTSDTQKARAGVAPTRMRGQKANWSPVAKTRTWLIAMSCIKQVSSPYRTVYDQGRLKYREALHQTECKRCGPAGKPAPVGSPLNAGHQHARAIRLVCKAILKDLWIEARNAAQYEQMPLPSIDPSRSASGDGEPG